MSAWRRPQNGRQIQPRCFQSTVASSQRHRWALAAAGDGSWPPKASVTPPLPRCQLRAMLLAATGLRAFSRAGLSSHSPPPPAAQLSAAAASQPGGQPDPPAAGPFDWIDPHQELDLFDRLLGIKPAGYRPSTPAAIQQASPASGASATPGAQSDASSGGGPAGQSRSGGDEQAPSQGSGIWWEPTRLFAALVRRCCYLPCYQTSALRSMLRATSCPPPPASTQQHAALLVWTRPGRATMAVLMAAYTVLQHASRLLGVAADVTAIAAALGECQL